MTKLNLGSGGRPLSDYLNIDSSPEAPAVDTVYDLDETPLAFR